MQEIKASNKRIAKNTMFLSIRMFAVLLIGLYTSRVILRELGVVDYGIKNVVSGFVAMFSFLNSSMVNAIQRFYNFEIGKHGYFGAQKVFNTSIVIQGIIALTTLLLIETVGIWYLYEKMVIPPDRFTAGFWCFQFSTIALTLNILVIPFSASIVSHEKMDYFAFVSVLDAVLKLGIAFAIPYVPGDKLIAYGILLLAITIINVSLHLSYSILKFDEIRFRKVYERKMFKEMLTFSGLNLFGTLARTGKEQGLNMLLNLFFGPAVNAARGLAYQVCAGIRGFVSTITSAARPQLTHAYAKDQIGRMTYIYYMMGKLCYLVVLLPALPVMFEVDYVMHLWLGDRVPEHTCAFINLILVSSLIHVFNPPTSFVVHATGKMKLYQFCGASVNLGLLPCAYVALKLGASPEMIFVMYCICSAVSLTSALLVVRTLVPLPIMSFLKKVFFPLLLVTAIAVAVTFIPHHLLDQGLLRLIAVMIVSSITITLFSYRLVLNENERNSLKEIVNTKLKKKKR